MKKRSITLKGHATSISLEDAFWEKLKDIAMEQGMSIPELINRIDEDNLSSIEPTGLSSAIRVYILNYLCA